VILIVLDAPIPSPLLCRRVTVPEALLHALNSLELAFLPTGSAQSARTATSHPDNGRAWLTQRHRDTVCDGLHGMLTSMRDWGARPDLGEGYASSSIPHAWYSGSIPNTPSRLGLLDCSHWNRVGGSLLFCPADPDEYDVVGALDSCPRDIEGAFERG